MNENATLALPTARVDPSARAECKAPLLAYSPTAQLLDENCANLPGVAGCHGGYSHGVLSSRGLQSTRLLTLQLHTLTHCPQSVSSFPPFGSFS